MGLWNLKYDNWVDGCENLEFLDFPNRLQLTEAYLNPLLEESSFPHLASPRNTSPGAGSCKVRLLILNSLPQPFSLQPDNRVNTTGTQEEKKCVCSRMKQFMHRNNCRKWQICSGTWTFHKNGSKLLKAVETGLLGKKINRLQVKWSKYSVITQCTMIWQECLKPGLVPFSTF